MAGSHAVGSDVTRFVCDADDTRILRIDPDATVTTTIGGVWENDGTTDASYYRFNGGPIGVRSITGSSDELTYIVSDMLGTVSVGYNHTTSGTVTRSWYDPWGVTRAVSGNTPTELSYTGQRQDPTGLMHYQARLYDPAYQTFLTPDTIIPNPTSPQDLNRYAYVRNNPVNYSDPSGHCPSELQNVSVLCAEHDIEVHQDGFSVIGAQRVYRPQTTLREVGETASLVPGADVLVDPFLCGGSVASGNVGGSAWTAAQRSYLFLVRAQRGPAGNGSKVYSGGRQARYLRPSSGLASLP